MGVVWPVVTLSSHFCLDMDLRLRENPTTETRVTGNTNGIQEIQTSHGNTRNRSQSKIY